MNRNRIFAAAAALAAGFVLSVSAGVTLSAQKGPCNGPVTCPTTDCVNGVGVGSAKCVGDGSLIKYCANTNNECCDTMNPQCLIAYCYSDPNCTGIRVVPCNVNCNMTNACGMIV